MSEKFQRMDLSRCSSCKGTWVGPDALRTIAETPIPSPNLALVQDVVAHEFKGVPEKDRHRAILCPDCALQLHPHNYDYGSGIIIDTCPRCHGIWLDSKELERIEVYEQHNQDEERKHHQQWEEQARAVEVGINQEFREAARDGRRASLQGFKHPLSTIEHTIDAIRKLESD